MGLALCVLAGCRGAPPMPAPKPEPTGGVRHEVLKRRDPATGQVLREWSVKVLPGERSVLHGRERTWTRDGALEWDREWRDGEPHGRWTRWWREGVERSRVEYAGKDVEWPMSFWHENGIKAMEGVAKDGVRCGEWTTWREDGSLESRGRYRDSFQDGEWIVYAGDGVTEQKRYWYERSVRTKVIPASSPKAD